MNNPPKRFRSAKRIRSLLQAGLQTGEVVISPDYVLQFGKTRNRGVEAFGPNRLQKPEFE
jgi:hypothetical protein